MHERRGKVEAASHPSRVGPDAAIGGPLEPDPVKQYLRLLLARLPGQPVQGRLEADQLAPGHQGVEGGLLERDADRAPDVGGVGDDVVAGDPRDAPGRAQQRG